MSESEKSRRLKQFGACLMVCGTAVCGGAELPPDRELRELAVRDSLNPVAPGGVNGAPFWNGSSMRPHSISSRLKGRSAIASRRPTRRESGTVLKRLLRPLR